LLLEVVYSAGNNGLLKGLRMAAPSGAHDDNRRDCKVRGEAIASSRNANVVPADSCPHAFPLKDEREIPASQDMTPVSQSITMASHFPWLPSTASGSEPAPES